MFTRLRQMTCVLLLVVGSAQTAAGQADTTRKTDTTAATAKPAALPTVMVSGRRVVVPSRYEDAYRRAASGRGVYFTREEIEATNPPDLAALMFRVPSVQVNDRGVTFEKCQAGLPSPGSLMQAAHVQVFIDGRRASLTTDDGVRQLLQSIPVSTVQLMEVYNGASRIPGEFVNDACAVIVIWTRSY